MHRCRVLFEFIIDELMDAAEAMADGTYWKSSIYDDGNFAVPHDPNVDFGGGD